MRRLLAVLACAVLTGVAQAQLITGAMLMPNPLGILVSLGQWINFEGEKTYYIEVIGQGATPDQARDNGFRLAVEQAVGTIVASESELNNSRLTRDEIITYSSGYVSRYEIVKQEPSSVGTNTTMKVWIKRNAIANRLLNESKTAGSVEGAQAAVSYRSIIQERQAGDRLLALVLADYPRRAFDIEMGKSRVLYEGRQMSLVIPYQTRLNSNYIDSLYTALKATEQAGPCAVRVSVSTQSWFGGGDITFGEYSKYDVLAQKFSYNPARLELSLYSESNTLVYRDIFPIKFLTPDPIQYTQPALFNITNRTGCPRGIAINGSRWIYGDLVIANIDPNLLSRVARIELKAVQQ